MHTNTACLGQEEGRRKPEENSSFLVSWLLLGPEAVSFKPASLPCPQVTPRISCPVSLLSTYHSLEGFLLQPKRPSTICYLLWGEAQTSGGQRQRPVPSQSTGRPIPRDTQVHHKQVSVSRLKRNGQGIRMFTRCPDDNSNRYPCERAGEAGHHVMHSLGGCHEGMPTPHVAGKNTLEDDVHVRRHGLLGWEVSALKHFQAWPLETGPWFSPKYLSIPA